jgi:hypothetical protein
MVLRILFRVGDGWGYDWEMGDGWDGLGLGHDWEMSQTLRWCLGMRDEYPPEFEMAGNESLRTSGNGMGAAGWEWDCGHVFFKRVFQSLTCLKWFPECEMRCFRGSGMVFDALRSKNDDLQGETWWKMRVQTDVVWREGTREGSARHDGKEEKRGFDLVRADKGGEAGLGWWRGKKGVGRGGKKTGLDGKWICGMGWAWMGVVWVDGWDEKGEKKKSGPVEGMEKTRRWGRKRVAKVVWARKRKGDEMDKCECKGE